MSFCKRRSERYAATRQKGSTNPQFARTGEELAILVEAYSHDAVRGVECLLDAVTVMNVNINVQDSRVVAK